MMAIVTRATASWAFNDAPTLTPYGALQPRQPLKEVNQRNAYRSRDAQALALDRPDEADEGVLNTLVWHAIKGPGVPMPSPKTAFRPPARRDDD